jgi:hypothetical protein
MENIKLNLTKDLLIAALECASEVNQSSCWGSVFDEALKVLRANSSKEEVVIILKKDA